MYLFFSLRFYVINNDSCYILTKSITKKIKKQIHICFYLENTFFVISEQFERQLVINI